MLNPQAGFGARGPFVTLIQQRLNALHVYVPQSGVFDTYTGLALDAYHRLLGHGVLPVTGRRHGRDLLDGVGTFHVRYPKDGTHVEGDLSRQLLAEINGSKVSGFIRSARASRRPRPSWAASGSTTACPDYLPDGMYYSSFFFRGYAIHGYDPAPDYPGQPRLHAPAHHRRDLGL